MSKFNKTRTKTAALSPIVTGRVPSGRTHEGAPGYARTAQSELFLLAVSNLAGEDTFYENATSRDQRYTQLVHEVAVADPQWTAAFLCWLRSEANMRSASVAGALEAAMAMLVADISGSRQLVASVLQRADEPGEALAYWTSHYGRAVPKPVKRGIADAVGRLYTEYSLLKYDGAAKGFRFADVIDLVHPVPVAPWQSDLFKVALERRHRRETLSIDALPMLSANASLRAAAARNVSVLADTERLKAAGMTWEDVLSLAGSLTDKKADKKRLWHALIPTMGYMACLRNIRNFDEAGVSDKAAAAVAARLSDPDAVRKSRQFPFRFLAAYEQAPSLRWGHALDKALHLSLANLPALPGRTLILVDTSASMTQGTFSARSKMTPAKAAAVFGVALAAKGERVDLHGFADGVFRHEVPKGASVLKEIDRFVSRTGEVGHGTQIAASVRATYDGHDRVVIISDMQTMNGSFGRGVSEAVPAYVPIYGFNLGGYQFAAYATGSSNRHEFGGLTDATFRMIPLLEAGRNARWPWM
ncbi:MAG TPA: TROVE domain-containing protein [Candidatus Limnocylindrales bacterium]|nr:TROVE domain-containing protein [Candidatus Limnocylindrales bacterium]